MMRLPRGFRDFPPEIEIVRQRVISSIEEVFRRYGFEPMETSSIELWETIKGKYGQEAESKLLFVFPDFLSKEWLSLRYDLTAPLARYVASHPELPLPFKRYEIGRVWRHEEPQRGRYREFWQCDADIVGSSYPEADAEIINLIDDAISQFGFEITIRLSDRRILSSILSKMGIDHVQVYRAVDKLDKIGWDGVSRELRDQGLKDEEIERIKEIISMGKIEDVERVGGDEVREVTRNLLEIIDLVKNKNKVVFDLSLVRGLDYYTGPIYEVVLKDQRIGSVAGGGRYDNLIKMYGGRDIPATGASIGVERLIEVGFETGIFKKESTLTQAYLISISEKNRDYCWDLCKKLRDEGIRTAVDLMRRDQRSQREHARKIGVRFLIFIGEKEEKEGMLTVVDSLTGERIYLKVEDAITEMKRRLSRSMKI
ncbi:MAG: histidine--tRNA ligase [Thermoproteota archaeon]|nr:MAG: histidine--tRNA ligase [Candidatus Korarchaeota archaeon]